MINTGIDFTGMSPFSFFNSKNNDYQNKPSSIFLTDLNLRFNYFHYNNSEIYKLFI